VANFQTAVTGNVGVVRMPCNEHRSTPAFSAPLTSPVLKTSKLTLQFAFNYQTKTSLLHRHQW
jgi:hypothetical protein